MRIEYALRAVASVADAVLAIGFFDGVHLEHRSLVQRAAHLARERSTRVVAVTFWPHPLAALRPSDPVSLLSTLEEKLALLDGLGLLDATVVLPFSPEPETSEPGAFLALLRGWSTPVALIEGWDFALDHVPLAQLRAASEGFGFAAESIEVCVSHDQVNSASIARLVREGQVTEATRWLARPYRLSGEVTLGDQRGRLLGFPTANLRVDSRKVLPANGVYAVRVALPGERVATHPAVANIGVRPTVSSEPRLMIEVHLLDAKMDLYGLTIGVDLIERLRDERRFDSLDALRAQIDRDAQKAREILAAPAEIGAASAGQTGDRSEASWAS